VPDPLSIYVIDTCSFTELRRAYPRPAFEAVWRLIERLVADGRLISVEDVLVELSVQDDEVTEWARLHSHIFQPLTPQIQLKGRDILAAYPKLLDLKKKKSSADPFVIAAAIVANATVVTQEKPSGGPPAVKIPDVCAHLAVPCINLLKLLQAEGLAT